MKLVETWMMRTTLGTPRGARTFRARARRAELAPAYRRFRHVAGVAMFQGYASPYVLPTVRALRVHFRLAPPIGRCDEVRGAAL